MNSPSADCVLPPLLWEVPVSQPASCVCIRLACVRMVSKVLVIMVGVVVVVIVVLCGASLPCVKTQQQGQWPFWQPASLLEYTRFILSEGVVCEEVCKDQGVGSSWCYEIEQRIQRKHWTNQLEVGVLLNT